MIYLFQIKNTWMLLNLHLDRIVDCLLYLKLYLLRCLLSLALKGFNLHNQDISKKSKLLNALKPLYGNSFNQSNEFNQETFEF